MISSREKSACCGVFEEKDENDHRTYYDYIGGRVARMRTDVQSPGQWLVTYDFDEFGNTLGVTTYKDALTARETTYTYDKLNRVTETDHPGTLGIEKFQYDKVGNLRAKMDGNSAMHGNG